ncbi:MAG: hypothetical protein HC780_09275 [Leptolyngbyaceae cyanobacterium CSU_1_3]|nr:hypothetical protein [Leptolyngbyaceae cyanobacterium CSU_1_3]
MANFGGDPDGAYPPKADSVNIHPYPALTMWGNFSNLRRAVGLLESGNSYNSLSVADKTYLQTAACTLGMLAYNIDQIQNFDPSNPANDVKFDSTLFGTVTQSNKGVMIELSEEIAKVMDGTLDPAAASPNFEVLPRGQMGTYRYDPVGARQPGNLGLTLRDYLGVPPEAFIGAIKQSRMKAGIDITKDPVLRMAELIMLKYQIRRDRTFGFRPSPIFGEYAIPFGGSTDGFPSACDPDEFALGSAAALDVDDPPILINQPSTSVSRTSEAARVRFNLSRLCGAIDTSKYVSGKPETASVLPKFPALYYLFPEKDHDLDGEIVEPSTVAATPPAIDPATPPPTPPAATPVSNTPNFTADKRDEYDIRQPGSIVVTTESPSSSFLPQYTANDKEPYVVDSYISGLAKVNNSGEKFRVIPNPTADPDLADNPRATNPSPYYPATLQSSTVARRPDPNLRPFPLADTSVKSIALTPRKIDFSDWRLPYSVPKSEIGNGSVSGGPNISTNIILAPTDSTTVNGRGTPRLMAIGFLDRAFFDGRQVMLTRTMDIDVGMLRGTRVKDGNDIWLPKTGIVYAFREDAVREDAIRRPADNGGMNLTDLRAQKDPNIVLSDKNRGVTEKPVDYLPDPDRRIHGFRLRNGSQLKRDKNLEGDFLKPVENDRGLSFFTDQPIYIQGDFNLHQNGSDDTVGDRLEEFTQTLPDSSTYTPEEFYGRTTTQERFANFDVNKNDAERDRWRPSEILADSITILSNNFCDGSIADSFVRPFASNSLPRPTANRGKGSAYPIPDFSILNGSASDIKSNYAQYNAPEYGLFNPGCASTTDGVNSFHNQNRPKRGIGSSTDWVRENSSDLTLPQRMSGAAYGYSADLTSPIKLSRLGHPMLESTSNQRGPRPLPASRPYNAVFTNQPYFSLASEGNKRDRLITPARTRVNTIVVSGISPSRQNQAYGGLHNFPRFLERWEQEETNTTDDVPLNFAGSFLQLSFSNYATAPYDLEAFEPGSSPASGEVLSYYSPPARLWGYDVALQFTPASPAASRFVTSSKNRNEYYTEPPANDPYINKLCNALKQNNSKLNCPSP